MLASGNSERISISNAELLGDLKLERELSRAGALLLSCVRKLSIRSIGLQQTRRERVGMYCCLEPGAVPDEAAVKFAAQTLDLNPSVYQPVELFRQVCNPKQHFRSTAPLSTARSAIELEVMGPTHTFSSLRYGCLQAAQQARLDLETDVIDFAIVAAARGLDPATTLPIAASMEAFPSTKMHREGVAVVALTKQDIGNWPELNPTGDDWPYGVVQPLVNFIGEL